MVVVCRCSSCNDGDAGTRLAIVLEREQSVCISQKSLGKYVNPTILSTLGQIVWQTGLSNLEQVTSLEERKLWIQTSCKPEKRYGYCHVFPARDSPHKHRPHNPRTGWARISHNVTPLCD